MSVKFTERAEKTIRVAGNEARRRSHEFVGTEHILYAVLTQREGPAFRALASLEIDAENLQKAAIEALERVGPGKKSEDIPFTPHAKRCLELASDEAVRAGVYYVKVEHILIGLLREEEGCASRLFSENGFDRLADACCCEGKRTLPVPTVFDTLLNGSILDEITDNAEAVGHAITEYRAGHLDEAKRYVKRGIGVLYRLLAEIHARQHGLPLPMGDALPDFAITMDP